MTIAQPIKAIAVGGHVTLIGSFGYSTNKIDVMHLLFSQATYQAIGVGSCSDLEAINRVNSQHKIHPVIDTIFDFKDTHDAYRYLQQRGRFGKIVIRH